jgi:cyanophycin synthetase
MIKNNTIGWSISSDLIIQSAIDLGYSYQEIVRSKNLFSLSDGERDVLFKNIDCGLNSALGFKITEDKELTYILLESHGIPVPRSQYVNQDEIIDNLSGLIKINFPLVVKPIDGAHGDGVSIDIMDND